MDLNKMKGEISAFCKTHNINITDNEILELAIKLFPNTMKGAESFKVEVDRIYRFDNGGQLKAFVDVLVDNCLSIKGFKVIDGKKGLFVSYPSEVAKDGKWYNTVLAITKDTKDQIEKIVLEAYKV